jgi:3D (Asp-Asp-Asp) domain-containing protein
LLLAIIFGNLCIDNSKELSVAQDNIIDQAIEINQLNDKNEELNKEVARLNGDMEVLKAYLFGYCGEFEITYYDSCYKCCGKTNGITASGAKVQEGVTVAADTSVFPMGSKIYIEGIGWRTVQDRGGAIKGKRIDIYIPDCHNSPMPYNKQKLNVWVVLEDV